MANKPYTREMRVASFFSRVEIKGETECWLWKGCTYNCGYGSFYWRDKMRAASRVSYEIATGQELPDDIDVLHRCDVRLCVNPAHLFLGTHKDNMLDMHVKGRMPTVALKPEQVRQIRQILSSQPYKRGMGTELARQFGVHVSTIHSLRKGKTYRYVE